MTTGMKLLLLKTKYIGDTLLLAGTVRAIMKLTSPFASVVCLPRRK